MGNITADCAVCVAKDEFVNRENTAVAISSKSRRFLPPGTVTNFPQFRLQISPVRSWLDHMYITALPGTVGIITVVIPTGFIYS